MLCSKIFQGPSLLLETWTVLAILVTPLPLPTHTLGFNVESAFSQIIYMWQRCELFFSFQNQFSSL